MPSNTDILKLKELYESLDRLQESGEDVVAEIRKEINNIELQYLKEDVFPEMMKTLSRKISWLRCSVDMSLQFDGEKQLDYSFCKSGSTVFVRDKYECSSKDNDIIETRETQETDATYSAIITQEPVSTSATNAIVCIVEYSDKDIAVYGDTMCYSEKFKEMGGYFNPRLRNWIFSKKHESEVRNLLKDEKTDEYTENPSPARVGIAPVMRQSKG